MSFGRQKRLLLGWLALLAPLPLPFNGVVDGRRCSLYLVGRRLLPAPGEPRPAALAADLGDERPGLAYIPLFFLDLLRLPPRPLVQPVLHLCLFALLVKLFAIVRERDKWQASIGVFFLFLAAMGTSVHPAIVLYLIAFLVLALVLLTRFAFLHVLVRLRPRGPGARPHPPARLPAVADGRRRWCSPCRSSRSCRACARRSSSAAAAAAGVTLEAAGFSDAGDARLDRPHPRQPRGGRCGCSRRRPSGADREMRFKAATYDVYQGGTWRRSPSLGTLSQRARACASCCGPRSPSRWATIWLQPLHSQSAAAAGGDRGVEPRSPRWRSTPAAPSPSRSIRSRSPNTGSGLARRRCSPALPRRLRRSRARPHRRDAADHRPGGRGHGAGDRRPSAPGGSRAT